jgi:hypothetical protein
MAASVNLRAQAPPPLLLWLPAIPSILHQQAVKALRRPDDTFYPHDTFHRE